MSKQTKDRKSLLRNIPSAAVVKMRLDKVLQEAAELKILLKLASEIEAAKPEPVSIGGFEDE